MTETVHNLGSLFFGIILPIIATTLFGFVLDRRFHVDLATLVRLNLYVFVPAFIFVRLIESTVPTALGFRAVGFTLTMIGIMALLSWLVAAITRIDPPARKALQLSTMFYNSGNYGIPLMTLAFAPLGPVLQAFVLMTMNISTFTIGLWLAASQNHDRTQGWWRPLLPVLRQPSIYAIALALTIKAMGLEDEISSIAPIWKPLGYLGDGLVGFALLTLGVQLNQTKPPPIRGNLALALAIRLLAAPLIAAGLVQVFRFEWEVARILILSTSVPTAVNTALLAHEYKADGRFASAVVFYSTIFSAITVTIVLFILKSVQ
tara:strand:- start:6691 stop:7644 length:954 start_codon:yes stop_codon:yes gene_type:complete